MNPDELRQMLRPEFIAGPATDEMIHSAETALGVSFPPSYGAFLRLFGAGDVGQFEIFGLASIHPPDSPPLWCDVVQVTLRARTVSRGAISNDLILISGDGCDYKFYLDLAQKQQNGESPAIALGPGADGPVVASDFVEFLLRIHRGDRLIQ